MIPRSSAVIADQVLVMDIQQVGLGFPGGLRVSIHRREHAGPLGMFHQVIVLTTIRLIDRVCPPVFLGNLVTPLANVFRHIVSLGGVDRPLATGVILVRFHTAARGMDDQGTTGTGGVQHLVHAGGHFADPPSGVQAVVKVPHVTDHDRRFCRRPFLRSTHHVKQRAVIGSRYLAAQLQLKLPGRFRRDE